jgi:hypothetical protein
MSNASSPLMEELRGALPWVVLGALALAAAITYFVITGSADQNTLPADYGHNI